jgi:hypothetical protein
MFFLATVIFVVALYVVPLHSVVYAGAPGWPTTPLSLSQALANTGINFPFWFHMVAIFGVLYLLVRVSGQLLSVIEIPKGARDAVNSIVKLRGLRTVQALGAAMILSTMAVILVSGAARGSVAPLGAAVLVAFLVSLAGGEPLPGAPPVGTVPLASRDPAVVSEARESEGDLHRTYQWQFTPHPGIEGGAVQPFTVDLTISKAHYESYKAEPRERDPLIWDRYVVAPCPEVDILALKLAELQNRRGYCTFDRAANVLAFAQQCIQYTEDPSPEGEPTDYPRYPIESLVEARGDCEDHAILAAAVLKRMGIDVALLIGAGHAALGVAGAEGLPGYYLEDPHTGVRYFYGETSSEGWTMGEVPPKLVKHVSRGEFTVLPIVMAMERA